MLRSVKTILTPGSHGRGGGVGLVTAGSHSFCWTSFAHLYSAEVGPVQWGPNLTSQQNHQGKSFKTEF